MSGATMKKHLVAISLIALVFITTFGEIAVAAPDLEIQSWRCESEHGYIFVRGEVRNISDKRLEDVEVVGTFLTREGEFVKTASALVEFNPILAGQTTPFEAGTTSNPAIKKCSIQFKYLFGGAILTINKGEPPGNGGGSHPNSNRDIVREAQQILNSLGYDAGPTDGIMGPRTEAAIRAFQEDIGVKQDGEIDSSLMSTLRDKVQ